MVQRKMEVTVSVIVHATESHGIILDAINETLGIKPEEFKATMATGHFENAIRIYDAKVSGRDAGQFVQRLSRMLPDAELDALVGQIEERVVDSRLHAKADKQVLVRDRRIEIIGTCDGPEGNNGGSGGGKDTIKIKIHTPIYEKSKTAAIFEHILRGEAGP